MFQLANTTIARTTEQSSYFVSVMTMIYIKNTKMTGLLLIGCRSANGAGILLRCKNFIVIVWRDVICLFHSIYCLNLFTFFSVFTSIRCILFPFAFQTSRFAKCRPRFLGEFRNRFFLAAGDTLSIWNAVDPLNLAREVIAEIVTRSAVCVAFCPFSASAFTQSPRNITIPLHFIGER